MDGARLTPQVPSSADSYATVTAAIAAELSDLLGRANVIWADPERLERYGHDESVGPLCLPEVVVKPARTEEVAAVLRLASRERIPVTPRGAGSGLSGGAVPVRGGIVLSLERMNRILEIDPANMTATVEPGVVTNDLDRAAREHGLFFAGYPMSLETCFIGGNVAENAGGGKAIKYGVTGRYVLGLEVVLPSGEVIRLGGKRVKDVTGYDLIHLLVGSEGTLGVFTAIVVRLLPVPKAAVSLLVPFPSVQAAIDAVPALMTQTGIIPTAIEFMDELSFTTSCRHLNEGLACPPGGAMLLIEVDGTDAEQVDREADAIGQLCLDRGALEVYVADNHTTRERLWRIRRNIAEAFKVMSPVQSLEDIVVPPAAIPALVPELARISAAFGVTIPSYGHAGDGNLHATLVKDAAMSAGDWEAVRPRALTELYRAVAALGGTISGEHGIGSKRREFLPLVLDATTVELMRRIKQTFDPQGILNPGKIF